MIVLNISLSILCFFCKDMVFIRWHKIKSAFFIRRQRIKKADCLLFYFSITSPSILERFRSLFDRSSFIPLFGGGQWITRCRKR